MDINATLVGQMITFALLVWFTMKFVWPLLERTMQERKEKIAEGLAAAERGHKELELARLYSVTEIQKTKDKVAEILEKARNQAIDIIENAKAEASKQREHIIAMGNAEVEQNRKNVETKLRGDLADLVIQGTEKLLQRNITDKDQKTFLDLGIKQ